MSRPSGCYVLDVGQGNATLIEGSSGSVLVDAGPGKVTVLQFLESHGVKRLEAVFISHADKDHLGGLMSILAKASTDPSFKIGHIYVNPDQRDTDVWNDVTTALDDMERRKLINFSPQVGPDAPKPMDLGDCAVAVLGPSRYMRLRAVDGKHRAGRKQTANSMSAVIHVSFGGAGWLLLPGDVDQLGLSDALERDAWRPAPVLVFPHHGGKAGTEAQTRQLAADIVAASAPHSVVFSGRGLTAKFPSAIVVDTLLSLPEVPTLLCVGQSPVLAERMARTLGSPHRNATGTLHVLPPDDQGTVTVVAYAQPIPSGFH